MEASFDLKSAMEGLVCDLGKIKKKANMDTDFAIVEEIIDDKEDGSDKVQCYLLVTILDLCVLCIYLLVIYGYTNFMLELPRSQAS